MKTLILGMGNPILTDDGIGLILAERLRKRISGADVGANAMIGMDLLDQIIGYDRLFVVDAMTASGSSVGEMKVITETGSFGSLHLFSSHGLNIFDLMDLGRRCGCQVPELAAVYGIEIGKDTAFGTGLTPVLQECLEYLEEEIVRDMELRDESLIIRPAAQSPD